MPRRHCDAAGGAKSWRRLDRTAQLGQAVAQSAGRQRLPADPTITGIDCVSQPQFDRMDPKLLGNAFNLTLASEGHLRVAEAAEGARFELVGVDHGAAAAQMRDPVRPARHQHGESSAPPGFRRNRHRRRAGCSLRGRRAFHRAWRRSSSRYGPDGVIAPSRSLPPARERF